MEHWYHRSGAWFFIASSLGIAACQRPDVAPKTVAPSNESENKDGKIVKSEAEWKKILTPAQYHVMREKGTEQAFTGAYWNTHEEGVYLCAACGNELFSSEQKFDSGTGWPSFWAPIKGDKVETETDTTYGMVRTEVKCSRCGGHLGHVFDDGPNPTGLRYCINSCSLEKKPPKPKK